MKGKVAFWVVSGLLVGALAGAVAAGWLFPRVDTTPIDNATKSLLVTATVEDKPVREVYSLGAQVTAASVAAVMPTGASGRMVVSGRAHATGDTIRFGDVVAEVSGRPVFAVPASLPVYRDLVAGDVGSDVAGLQRMLTDLGLYAGAVDGKLSTGTAQAISRLHTRAGYPAPNPVALLTGDVAALPADGLVVAEAAGVGQEITTERPLMSVVVAPAVITARVDMLQAQVFLVGTAVNVQVGSAAPAPSSVLSVGEFQEGSAGNPPGYDIKIGVPEGVDPESAAQQPVIVSEADEVPTGPAVPLAAVRRDAAASTYVELPRPTSATPGPPQRVAVTVVGQSAGWAVIADNPDLPVGASVVVSGG